MKRVSESRTLGGVKPGLHALSCSRCGAPLDPTERAKGSVVTCEHCEQPHLWVAPGKVEAQPAPPLMQAAPARRSSKAPLLIGLAVIALVLLAGMGSAIWLVGGRAPAGGFDVPVTPEMPIAIGDNLHMQIDNHGCDVDVRDVLADGRLLGVSCGAQEASPLDRSLLTVEAFPEKQSYANPEAGDIVLVEGGAGWERRAVVGPEPGKKFRVRPLVNGKGKEEVVERKSVLRVYRASRGTCWIQVPLDASVALEAGDALYVAENNVSYMVTVVADQGEQVSVQRSGSGDRPEEKRKKTSLSALAICARSAVAADTPVLIKDGAKWLRRQVVSDDGTSVQLKDPAGGAVESRPKVNLVALRAP